MKAAVVIGANYGDEGKGLVTDYLASLDQYANAVVIRFNGGAQAGHTVQRPEGLRHVFSHFGSGTLAGAPTYLSDFFIANPVLFNQELKKLHALGISPKISIHPHAMVTTPYDMYINQILENFRGQHRHGSCGVGIGETIERNLYPKFQLTVEDLSDNFKVKDTLLKIREEWVIFRLNQFLQRRLHQEEMDFIFSTDVFDYFLEEIQIFLNHCHVVEYNFLSGCDSLIFEGAQGLLLDQGHHNFPHVTRSHTGLQNVSMLMNTVSIQHLDIHYVTRCYLTRHGAGPLPNECFSCPCPYFKDETNVPHDYQGVLRFAPLHLSSMCKEIATDLQKLPNHISNTVTLAVTCLDQFEEEIPVVEENIMVLKKEKFLDYVVENTMFDDYLLSFGPAREDCSRYGNV